MSKVNRTWCLDPSTGKHEMYILASDYDALIAKLEALVRKLRNRADVSSIYLFSEACNLAADDLKRLIEESR